MSQQEEGWPLGLQPLNMRAELRNHDHNRSLSFNTLFTGSSSLAHSSSDLDTESTGSLFHDKGITLGSLIGISSILELSRRSMRGRTIHDPIRDKKNDKSRPWFFSLCSKLTTDGVNMNNDTPSSLGHLLEVERQETNSLFVGNLVAPPLSRSNVEEGESDQELFDNKNGHGVLLLSCLCGQLSH